MTDPLPPTLPAPPRRGPGRPPVNLYETIGHAPDGRAVTRLDRVREVYAVCGFDRDAAARCGVALETYRDWVRAGTRLLADLEHGRTTKGKLKKHEKGWVELVRTIATAEAEGRLLMLALADAACRPGRQAETVTVRTDGKGQELERTTRSETILPDMAMVRWRLERRWPADYGRSRLEVTGADGGPIEVADPSAALLAHLDRIAEARRAAAPETNGHHAPDPVDA